MKKLDLNLVPIVLALYDQRSVSRAAEALGMSQPAVSMALKKMRAVLRDHLFVRVPGGIAPTPRTHALVRTIRPLVTDLCEALRAVDEFCPQASTRAFTFALSDVGEMVFLPRLLEHLRAHAPQAPIKSVSMPPSQLEQGLGSGEIDLALGYFPDLNENCFFQQRLFTHRFACLMRAGHPLYATKIGCQ